MRHFPGMHNKGELCCKCNESSGIFRLSKTELFPSQVALLQLAWSGMTNRVSSASLLLSSWPWVIMSERAQIKQQCPFSSTLPSVRSEQIHKSSLETDAKTLTHASIPKQNQADLCLLPSAQHLRSQRARAHTHTHTNAQHTLLEMPLWCHCRETVYCGTRSRHSSLTAIKKNHYKMVSGQETGEIFGKATLHSFVSPVEKMTEVNWFSRGHSGTLWCRQKCNLYVWKHNCMVSACRRGG